MDKHEKVSKEESNEPEGVTVSAADGSLFFLPKADADRFRIPENQLYAAFRALRLQESQNPIERSAINCGATWRWLESHGPNSATWRRKCLQYFDNCV